MKPSQKDTQAKQEIRAWLARKLVMEDVPEPLWRVLEEENLVSDAVKYPGEKEEYLLKPAKRYLRFNREMGGYSGVERVRDESVNTSYVLVTQPGDPMYERA